MPGGGWVATHEDITEQAHRNTIDSAISSFRERVETVLKTGQLPYFDTVGSGMAEVVKGTSQLTDADRHAIAVYLKSLKPVPGS